MSVVALFVLVITVLVGVLTLAEFADPKRMSSMPRAVPLAAVHVVLALSSTVTWSIFLVVDSTAMGWIGAAVIACTAAAGLFLFTRSARFAGTDAAADVHEVSTGLLVVHGAVAGLTVMLALLAAVGVGR